MKVLIIKTSALGDIVQSFPVIDYLREKYVNLHLDWVVEKHCAPLVLQHPGVNRAFVVQTKKWRYGKNLSSAKQLFHKLREQSYNLVIDLQGNCKSAFFTRLARGNEKVGFGKKSVSERPNLWVTTRQFDPPPGQTMREDYLFLVQRACGDNRVPKACPLQFTLLEEEQKLLREVIRLLPDSFTLLSFGSAWENKQIPLQTCAQFLRGIEEEVAPFCFIWGTVREREVSFHLNKQLKKKGIVLPKVTLPVLQEVMKRGQLVIAVDSLPLHLAATAGVETFGFFGPSRGKKYAPAAYFQGACPYGRIFTKRCPVLRTCKTGACIRSQSYETLVEHFSRR